ncbi:porin family protein [Prolixibacteraceae bacterium Z1-6]|uniref:Porin family protein n=1 Tax=Draconibacterium aestuarii TaxID=2998507 RepID=A0A9X3J7F7_9BACT|nr:porin family protein [Prolixibacteraceae bacterium Z1-6]
MKKILILLGLIVVANCAQSQILISLLLGDKLNSADLEFGLEGGVNFTQIYGFESSSNLANLNLGFYFDIRMKDQLFLHTGLQAQSRFGLRNLTENDLEFLEAEIEDVEGKYSQKVKTFTVPILANYKFKNHMYVEAGPQFGWNYNSYVEFESDVDNREVKIKDYNDDLLNWFNAGVAFGTGYKLLNGEGWTIGVRYYQGFTKVFKDRSGSNHNSFTIKVNIPIGVASAKHGKDLK